ncbi:MAG: Alpha/Beta hydrolase protein [Piptocephalis tieghemiana]|nr:MAG: Alpha/Beta hydrolase protein [Piptocephalis tieghemiana]
MSTSSHLYPPIEPYDQGHLSVSSVHSVYYECSGNSEGKPVLFLHGGPGGGVSPRDRRYFDPKVYRIVLLDQRGAGKSTPSACLEENTTWHLVEDIEKLREHLSIDTWVVFGGSWGSTLSLAYAQTHPTRVQALILRGIFTLRQTELSWFYESGGAEMVFPDAWEEYIKPIPEAERNAFIPAYYKRLTGSDRKVQQECASAWSKWECSTCKLNVDPEEVAKAAEDAWALAFARIECHYFINHGFFKPDSQLLDNVDKIRHIPTVIVQGRYDMVCPATTAWDLHRRWPEAEFNLISAAGHSAKEPGIEEALVQAADKFKTL